jgi:hypothetical protein
LAERGILLLDRLTAVARLPAAGVKELKVQQALKNSCRVGAMVALSLTRHLLPTPQGGLLMMFKANRRGSARIKKSWSVLFALRTTTQISVRNSAGQNRRWLSAVLQRMVWASFRFRL